MVGRMAKLVLLTVLVGACAAYPSRARQRLETLPQRYSQFDMVMAWETKNEGAHTVVDGVVKNVRYFVMNGVEVWVAVLDDSGKVASRSVSFIIPTQLYQDQSAEFSVKLPVRVEPGTRLRFTYKYKADEGGDNGRGPGITDWMQSFETVVPAR